LEKIKSKQATIGIVGLGYVGLPLAQAFCRQGVKTVGFDIDQKKIDEIEAGRSYIKHIGDHVIQKMRADDLFDVTTDFTQISNVDVIIICVPTPLSKHREPDLGPVLNTGKSIMPHLQKGQLVILESSTYPGTTDTELAGVLAQSGLKKDEDFYLAYSPEREDPGNETFSTSTIPKIVGADTPLARDMAVAVYEGVISEVIPVSSSRTAEAIKLTENIFRSVNIALVNELKVIFDAMDIDVWDVIDGAATKPFGFMPFYPGPGLGGHCIPIDPFYLTYKAREYHVPTRFIELAGEINTKMPQLVVAKTGQALSQISQKALNGASILIIGMAYKKNVDDMRESPSLVLTELLEAEGAKVAYHDPYVTVIPRTRQHNDLAGRESLDLTPKTISQMDVVLISTNHDGLDYQMLADNAALIIDTRNAMRHFPGKATVVKA
ncbi:MAG: UDP-N-acetyl-D-glucosamine dehydrogenase, partial [Rhodobiaceae bacterium]|nr:UDP-N-acetyl-D-glucosamine dehydrogenase [Rhodobiaceae bacterium]